MQVVSAPLTVFGRLRFVQAWATGAAIGLGLLGLMLMLAGAEDGPLWQKADAIFGASTRTMLRVGSLAHLLLAGYMAFARQPLNQALLALWLALNWSVYRAGLVWMGEKGPLPVLQCTGDVIGINPQTLSIGWTLFTVYLTAGGVMVLLVEWRRWKRMEAESFLERWRQMRQAGGTGMSARGSGRESAPLPPHQSESGAGRGATQDDIGPGT